MPQNDWFAVDKEGLRKLIEHRGRGVVLYELVQNCWDTEATTVEIELEKIPGRPFAHLVIRDDHPDGFTNLAHAYTLFAESEKKGNPALRGFMNLGEKLVLSLCRKAEVRSTTGTVTFNEDGTMTKGRRKTEAGTIFEAEMRMTQPEYQEILDAFWNLIPTGKCRTTLNTEELTKPELVCSFETILPTRIADDEGTMRMTKRKTEVQVYKPRNGEPSSIYELGIPVVETGDRYHVCVMQKVPVTMDRSNVPPSYLKKIRAEVLNRTAHLLTEEEASESWVTNGLESADIEPEAVNTTLDKRYGKKRAIADPNDREADRRLHGRGYTIIHGRSLPKDAWGNIRRAKAARPSGQIAPSTQPYSNDPSAPVVHVIPRNEWTTGMRQVYDITRWFADKLDVHDDLHVRFVKPHRDRRWAACFGDSGLDWNMICLGRKFFDEWYKHPNRLLKHILHEICHDGGVEHLQEKFEDRAFWHGANGIMLAFLEGSKIPHFQLVKKYLREQG